MQKAPQPTPSQPYPPPAPEGSLKIASILLSTAGPSINTSDILWLKSQILLSSGEYKKCHELLLQHGQGGSLARDWYRMKGIEEISKRVEGDKDWIWEKELGEFLDYWSKDDLAYVHSSDIRTRADSGGIGITRITNIPFQLLKLSSRPDLTLSNDSSRNWTNYMPSTERRRERHYWPSWN
jgi:hypothetical protein